MSHGLVFVSEAYLALDKYVESESIDLVYIDPPFNTGAIQKRGDISYDDKYSITYIAWLKEHVEQLYRVMKPNATLYLHVDQRESHYVKVMLDEVFGRDNFINEIIWAYDYGGRSKRCWPHKHDNIFMYAKGKNYIFNWWDIQRIPYMAPGLVSIEKAKIGKIPTDVWWNTIVATQGIENVGYPNQKPLSIVTRIIEASSIVGDTVLDCFAGSGTVGVACANLARNFVLMDNNNDAINISLMRLARAGLERQINLNERDNLTRTYTCDIIFVGENDSLSPVETLP